MIRASVFVAVVSLTSSLLHEGDTVNPPSTLVIDTATAYCLCRKCCEKWADQKVRVTATGRDAYLTDGIAVDPKAIPYGTILEIPGVGKKIADDTGGAMRKAWRKRNAIHIDIRFADRENPARAHRKALQWGVKRNIKVKILRWGGEMEGMNAGENGRKQDAEEADKRPPFRTPRPERRNDQESEAGRGKDSPLP